MEQEQQEDLSAMRIAPKLLVLRLARSFSHSWVPSETFLASPSNALEKGFSLKKKTAF